MTCKCEGEVEREDHSRRNTAHLSEDVPSAACNRAGKWRDTADSNSAFGLSPFGVIWHISLRKSFHWKLRQGVQRSVPDYSGIHLGIPAPGFQKFSNQRFVGRAPTRSQLQTSPPSQDKSQISQTMVS